MTDIVFDIGGTNMRVARVASDGTLEDIVARSTPQTKEDGLKQLKSLCHAQANGKSVERIAGGLAGILEYGSGVLLRSPNLSQWEGVSLEKELKKEFGASVKVANDTALGALGEARRGAGQGYEIVAYLAVGTGVGGARVVKGNIDETAFGFEPGHQIIQHETGESLESLVGGRSVQERMGATPGSITDPVVWEAVAKTFAVGVVNTIVHWSPHVVVLGGSMVTDGNGISVAMVREEVARLLHAFPRVPEIKRADIGGSSVLLGAVEYLL